MSEIVQSRPALGSVAWVRASRGRLTMRERWAIAVALVPGLRDGFRLRRQSLASGRRAVPLDTLAPPDTPMVRAASAYLAAHSEQAMANHAHRTAYWTLAVLHGLGDVDPATLETAWVAA